MVVDPNWVSNHKYYQYQTATYCNDRITRRCLGPRSQCGRFQYWPSTVNRMPEPIRREQLGPLAGAKPIIVVKQNTPLRPWCFSSPTTRVEPFELASTRLRQTRFVKSLENSPGFKKKHTPRILNGHSWVTSIPRSKPQPPAVVLGSSTLCLGSSSPSGKRRMQKCSYFLLV